MMEHCSDNLEQLISWFQREVRSCRRIYEGSSVKCITGRLFQSCRVIIRKSFLGNPIMFRMATQEIDVE